MAYVFEVTNFLLGFDQCFLFIADLFTKNYSRMYKCHYFTFQSLDFELKIAIISFQPCVLFLTINPLLILTIVT